MELRCRSFRRQSQRAGRIQRRRRRRGKRRVSRRRAARSRNTSWGGRAFMTLVFCRRRRWPTDILRISWSRFVSQLLDARKFTVSASKGGPAKEMEFEDLELVIWLPNDLRAEMFDQIKAQRQLK